MATYICNETLRLFLGILLTYLKREVISGGRGGKTWKWALVISVIFYFPKKHHASSEANGPKH